MQVQIGLDRETDGGIRLPYCPQHNVSMNEGHLLEGRDRGKDLLIPLPNIVFDSGQTRASPRDLGLMFHEDGSREHQPQPFEVYQPRQLRDKHLDEQLWQS